MLKVFIILLLLSQSAFAIEITDEILEQYNLEIKCNYLYYRHQADIYPMNHMLKMVSDCYPYFEIHKSALKNEKVRKVVEDWYEKRCKLLKQAFEQDDKKEISVPEVE